MIIKISHSIGYLGDEYAFISQPEETELLSHTPDLRHAFQEMSAWCAQICYNIDNPEFSKVIGVGEN